MNVNVSVSNISMSDCHLVCQYGCLSQLVTISVSIHMNVSM